MDKFKESLDQHIQDPHWAEGNPQREIIDKQMSKSAKKVWRERK